MLAPPPDVVVARALRSLTTALLVCCGVGLALGLLAIAILALAGGSAAGLASGLVLLGVGQAGAIAGAGAVGLGLRKLVGSGRGTAAPHDGATPEDAAAAERILTGTGRTLALEARGLLAACVLVAAAWTLVDPAAALGCLLGALVAAQVAVVLLVVRRRLDPPPDSTATHGAP